MIECRTCALDTFEKRDPAGHQPFEGPVYCSVCRKEVKGYSHLDEDYWGDAIECSECHNYIIYLSPEKQIWKDEVYLDNETLVIRDIESNETRIFVNDRRVTDIQGLLWFNSISDLQKRIKTILVFS